MREATPLQVATRGSGQALHSLAALAAWWASCAADINHFPQSRQLFDFRIGRAFANPLRLRAIGCIGIP